MNRKSCRGWFTAGFATAALAFGANALASQPATEPAVTAHPSNYASLVGTSREDADKKMGKLGFKMKKEANEDRGSLWWNGATKECVELRGKNGKVKSIEPTTASRCH